MNSVPILLVLAFLAVLLIAVLVARTRVGNGSFWPFLGLPGRSHDYLSSVRQIEDEVRDAATPRPPKDPAP